LRSRFLSISNDRDLQIDPEWLKDIGSCAQQKLAVAANVQPAWIKIGWLIPGPNIWLAIYIEETHTLTWPTS
jgi:hypothetical protein